MNESLLLADVVLVTRLGRHVVLVLDELLFVWHPYHAGGVLIL